MKYDSSSESQKEFLSNFRAQRFFIVRARQMIYNSTAHKSCERNRLKMKKMLALLLALCLLLPAVSALALTENSAYKFAKDVVKDCLPQCGSFRFLSDGLQVWQDGLNWAVYGDCTYTYRGTRYEEPYAVYFSEISRGEQEVLMVALSDEIVYGDAETCYEAGWEYGEILDTIEYYYYAQPGGEDYVWIPASGTLYHSRSDCSGMRSPTYEPVTDELLRRYRPCSKCWSY